MSPEQARGRPVDRRADLWAFGCVLFEMLSGRRAFAGVEVTDVLAEVIKSEPDWSALPDETPPGIARLLKRCLAKDARQRLADASRPASNWTMRSRRRRIQTTEIRYLFDADGAATFAPPDHVLFVREGVLYAQRIDAGRFTMVGNAAPLASGFAVNATTPRPMSAGSGVIAYRAAPAVRRQLKWYDRSGHPMETVGEALTDLTGGRLSPDGGTVAVTRDVHGQEDIWLMETARGTTTRLTSDSASRPAWSPDGTRIAFQSVQDGFVRIYSRTIGATGPDQPLFHSTEAQNMCDWSPDGKDILFASQSAKTGRDLWVLPVADAEHKPVPFSQAPAQEPAGSFSPDGKWVAYLSDETGRMEIFVKAFPGGGRAWRVSINGIAPQLPLWRKDGKEVYYVAPGGGLMAVPLKVVDTAIDVGTPAALFKLAGLPIAAERDRFLVLTALEDALTSPITVIVNWAGREQ